MTLANTICSISVRLSSDCAPQLESLLRPHSKDFERQQNDAAAVIEASAELISTVASTLRNNSESKSNTDQKQNKHSAEPIETRRRVVGHWTKQDVLHCDEPVFVLGRFRKLDSGASKQIDGVPGGGGVSTSSSTSQYMLHKSSDDSLVIFLGDEHAYRQHLQSSSSTKKTISQVLFGVGAVSAAAAVATLLK